MLRFVYFVFLLIGFQSLLGDDELELKPTKPYKTLDWRVGLHYDLNFADFKSRYVNYSSSIVSGPELKVGFMYRPARRFSVEFGTGIGAQMAHFSHNGNQDELAPADLEYLKELFSAEFIAKIQDAIATGKLENVWNLFDWSKLNYDYIPRKKFDDRIMSYSIPVELRLNWHIDNKWIAYLGGVYHKGGFIDDGRVFLGASYSYFDMRLGYVFYVSDRFHPSEYSKITKTNKSVPIALSIGLVF